VAAAVARDVLAVRDLQNLLIVAAVAFVVPVLIFPAPGLSILRRNVRKQAAAAAPMTVTSC
jgi:hypothetical protein